MTIDPLTLAMLEFEQTCKEWEDAGGEHGQTVKVIRNTLKAMLHIREITQPGQHLRLCEAIDIIGQVQAATFVKVNDATIQTYIKV